MSEFAFHAHSLSYKQHSSSNFPLQILLVTSIGRKPWEVTKTHYNHSIERAEVGLALGVTASKNFNAIRTFPLILISAPQWLPALLSQSSFSSEEGTLLSVIPDSLPSNVSAPDWKILTRATTGQPGVQAHFLDW